MALGRAETVVAYTMFNVWLPAVLEDRAEGEGDQAIRVALKEFVLYSRELGAPYRSRKCSSVLISRQLQDVRAPSWVFRLIGECFHTLTF
jgi:hypothetical protein